MTKRQTELIKSIRKGLAAKAPIFSHYLKAAHDVENAWVDKVLKFPDVIEASTSQEHKGSFPDYDVWAKKADGSLITYEVKADNMALGTGNIAVEVSRNIDGFGSRPTCISTSKSDYFVYYFGKQFHMMPTEKLRGMVKGRSTILGGDGKRSNIVLIPVKEFIDACEK
jgi:hypothetical protein